MLTASVHYGLTNAQADLFQMIPAKIPAIENLMEDRKAGVCPGGASDFSRGAAACAG
jgi:hypothetical protein